MTTKGGAMKQLAIEWNAVLAKANRQNLNLHRRKKIMTRKKLSTKILSFVLSAAMLFSTIPTTVFATEGEPAQPPAQSEQTTPPETLETPEQSAA